MIFSFFRYLYFFVYLMSPVRRVSNLVFAVLSRACAHNDRVIVPLLFSCMVFLPLRLPDIARTSRAYIRLFSSAAPHRPYRFHVGASFAGKPNHDRKDQLIAQIKFPETSQVAQWARDQWNIPGKLMPNADPGQDAFFIQELSQNMVSLGSRRLLLMSLTVQIPGYWLRYRRRSWRVD